MGIDCLTALADGDKKTLNGQIMKFRAIALGCASFAALAACGGGSNPSAPVAASASVTASAPAASEPVANRFTVKGVAGDGHPLVGVPVTVTDSTGQTTQSAVTNANGQFAVVVKGIAPLILTVPFNDIDGTPAQLSSVLAPAAAQNGQAVTLQANINPLTSLATQRVLGFVPTTAPSAAQISAAKITATSIAQGVLAVNTPLQPVYAALNIGATETADPIGNGNYQATPADPLDNLFDIARFSVHTGQVSVGTDASRVTLSIPASGAVSSPVPAAAVTSLVALNNGPTTTPIQHVIVVVGENQTFDAVFGTYQPPPGQTVKNLLSEGIVNADGSPGPNFALARQSQAGKQTSWTLNPARTAPFAYLPQPVTTGLPPPLQDPGGTGSVADTRFPANLPNGPFQLTKYTPYTSTTTGAQTGDPVHRFFQMWQQTGGDNSKLDLYTWVAITTGQGGDTAGITPANPAQGGELMSFLNMAAGDAPLFKSLAQHFAVSDNYHQSIMGGTGMNFFALATGDLPVFNTSGAIGAPPANQIDDPTPQPSTDNFYSHDGYQGGSYVNCSDINQPGVAPILDVLARRNIKSNCDTGKFYLVNNYNQGFDMNGYPQPIGPNDFNYPPQTVPTIAEALAKKGVTWKWYTGGREASDVASDGLALGFPTATVPASQIPWAQGEEYNNGGDPLVGSSMVMTTSALKANLVGLTTFQHDLAGGTLPAVSFVVPKNLDSGHPGYSAPAKYEAYLNGLIASVQANPALWAHTAILIITDEGGGYFDTGYIQSLDFFGDGPRIPMLAISPYARTGFIDHSYYDHSSVLKFIERNWRLAPLSPRSRDGLPNAIMGAADPYRPVNNAAIGDLMAMFDF
jgi:phospholipase C